MFAAFEGLPTPRGYPEHGIPPNTPHWYAYFQTDDIRIRYLHPPRCSMLTESWYLIAVFRLREYFADLIPELMDGRDINVLLQGIRDASVYSQRTPCPAEWYDSTLRAAVAMSRLDLSPLDNPSTSLERRAELLEQIRSVVNLLSIVELGDDKLDPRLLK